MSSQHTHDILHRDATTGINQRLDTWLATIPGASLGGDLASIEALSTTGIAVRTAADTWATRTLQAPAAGFTITNPAGIAGDPTFVLAHDLAALEALGSTGLAERTGSNTWAQRTIGVGGSTQVPDRAAGDTRWGQLAATNTWTADQLATFTGSPEVTTVGGFFNNAAWFTHHRLYTNDTATSGGIGISHYTATIMRDFEGYDVAGYPRADGALFVEAKKNNYKTTLYEGQVVPLFVMGVCGRVSNVAAMNFGSYKVFSNSDGLGDYNGSALGLEGRVVRMNVSGATTQSTAVIVGWSMSTTEGSEVYFASDGTLGFCVESEIGNTFASYAAVETVGDIEHLFVASSSRAVANIFYSITGNAHADGPGLTRGLAGSASLPAYSILADTNTGIYFPAADQVGISCGGTVRLTASTTALTVADAINVALGTTTGTKFGTATSQKLAFYNATPIVQQTGVAVTAGGIHAALVTLGLITA